jgi:two-component sensor histidine kinase
VGRPFAEAVSHGEEQGLLPLLDSVYHTGEPENGVGQRHSPAYERPVYVSYTVWAVSDDAEHAAGLMIQVTDTTEAVLLHEDYERAESQIRQITQELILSNVRQHELLEEAEILNIHLQQAMVETHHRVKNNLQVITALIELRLASADETVPMSEFARLGTNIRALGVIHDILTKEARDGGQQITISAKTVLEELLAVLQQTVLPRRLNIAVNEARVTGRQASSLALIANELVLNAFKHGRGEIEITFGVRDRTARLEVCDDGPGFPAGFDPNTAANIGLELIETLTRFDLGGQTAYGTRAEGGARVAVVFPLPSTG